MRVSTEIPTGNFCIGCNFYIKCTCRCSLFGTPIPVNIELKPLKCEQCKEMTKDYESKN